MTDNTAIDFDVVRSINYFAGLTYEDIELMQFILNNVDTAGWYISESMYEKIDALKLKLIAIRAQSEYLKVREE